MGYFNCMKLSRRMTVLIWIGAVSALLIYPSYKITETLFNNYFDSWGDRLAALEEQGLLSREFGAAWQDVLAGEEMDQEAAGLTDEGVPGQRLPLFIAHQPVKCGQPICEYYRNSGPFRPAYCPYPDRSYPGAA